MSQRPFRRRQLFAAAFVAFVAVSATAGASHDTCRNEPVPEDTSADLGPGVLFVGVDLGTNDQQTKACVASDILGPDVIVRLHRGDLPQMQPGTGCAVDLLGGTCEVTSFQVVVGESAFDTIEVARSGLPAGNGTTPVNVTRTCLVGVGQPCT